jgi:hypothetical protein
MSFKCNKCGADIPDGASFCPSCGASKPFEQPAPMPTQPVTPPPQPAYQPPAQPKPKRSSGNGMQGIVDTFFSKQMIMIGLFVGILVAWISKVIGEFVNQFSLESDILNVMNYTFLAGAGIILLGGGILNNKFNNYIRVGLIVAGGVILAMNL